MHAIPLPSFLPSFLPKVLHKIEKLLKIDWVANAYSYEQRAWVAPAARTPGAAMPRAQKAQRLGLRPAWPRAGGARSPEPAHNPAQGTMPSGWGCGQPGHPTDLRKK